MTVVGSTLSVHVSPFMCQHGLTSRPASQFLGRNGIVHRAGKSIIQMLLRGHQITADGRSSAVFSSCSVCAAIDEIKYILILSQ